jgi:Insecticide toxin TcdB middle/N-terminal region
LAWPLPFDGNLAMKSNTAGVTFGFNYTKNEGMLALVDINGDGLADKVYKKGSQLSYRPNQSGPNGATSFGAERPISGINEFSRGETFAGDVGLESNFVVYAGFEYTRTEDITSVYFSDVNGDQLMDIVKDGKVYFNHINNNGNPSFTLSSGDTPSPINAAAGIDSTLVENNPQELETAIDDNPLHDVVKVWRAPFNGTVSIHAPVNLLMDTSAEAQAYTFADGVRAAIQLKGTELWFTDIAANDFTPKTPTGVNAIAVQKGDKIYFRVQSKFNGAYDQVLWTPEITYTVQTPEQTDANALPLYQFKSDKDFLISADGSTGMTIGGDIKITGNFSMPAVTDEVSIRIQKKSGAVFSTVLQQSFPAGQAVNFPVSVTHNVLKNDALYFNVSAATNIDWTKLQWNPFVYFETTTDTVITRLFDDSSRPLVYTYPIVYYKSFNRTIQPSAFWTAPVTDTFAIRPQPAFNLNFETGTLVFSIKKQNQLIARRNIAVNAGIVSSIVTDSLILNAGDKLYFEYHTSNTKLADAVNNPNVVVRANPGSPQNVTAGFHTIDESFIFGPMYRHWGQFAYNGNRSRAASPIVESELKLDESLTDQNPPSIDLSGDTTAADMQNTYDAAGGNKPKEDKFIYLVPDKQKQLLIGYDNLTYIKKDTFSASRMGKDNLLPVNPIASPVPGSGSGAAGITKVSSTDNFSLAAGLVLLGSASFGFTNFKYDFTDMNGDRYPDILSTSKIQYTQPFGGLEATAKDISFGSVTKSEHYSLGLTLGGSFLRSNASTAKATSKGSRAAKAGSQSEASIGITGSINYNADSTAFAWLDVNGDDLPDRVYKGGNVELNLGYSFLPAENWGFGGLQEGSALSYGVGLGVNIGYGSISGGFGLTRSESETGKTLQDMNGDGLLDYVITGSPLKVAINKGNGFAPPVEWTGASSVQKSTSTGESVNGAFTIGIPIIPIVPVVKLCINPSFNIAQGADKTTVQFEDINGDGFPDFLESSDDSKITVSRSTIGRTNKLKKVSRPLGACFTLDYKRVGNTYLMPNNVWALASVEVYDGVPGDGAGRMRSSFDYENGRYDRNEREFFGFEKVITSHHDTENGDVVYRKNEQAFINDNFYEKGLVKSEVVKNAAGNKFNEAVFTYELKDIQNGTALPNSFKQVDDGAAFPAVVKEETFFYEGLAAAGKSTAKTYLYDVLGNITSTTDAGDAGPDDDFTELTAYHAVPAKYIMDMPASVTTSGNGQVYRQEASTIDGNGNITENRRYLQSGEVAKNNMEYDAFGNLAKITRPENATGQRLSYTYEYDSEVQT